MFEYLSGFRVVLVSGPHRSGTTVMARAIAHDAGLTFYPEEAFGHDNVTGWLALIRGMDRDTLQCPSMCAYLDGPGQADDVATVMVRRELADILVSQAKVGWTADNPTYGARYRAELKLYGIEGKPLAMVKYEYWDNAQRDVVAHPFEVEYEDLRDHPLWVPRALRAGWGPRQTE